MAQSTFQGPVRSLNGFISNGPGAVAAVAGTTATIDATYCGKTTLVSAATTTITLPAIVATADNPVAGPGADPSNMNNLGSTFTFVLTATATAVKIICAGSGTPGDLFIGSLVLGKDGILTAGGTATFVPNGSSNDAINLNGTTTGGIAGSTITVTAVAANKWMVSGTVIGSGTLATPFADS